MIKMIESQRGFTLIEMMIVLMIISILLLIAVPNMSKSHEIVNRKSCEATVKLVESQITAYEMEHQDTPLTDLSLLVSEGYINSISCPDGNKLELVNGDVVSTSVTPTTP